MKIKNIRILFLIISPIILMAEDTDPFKNKVPTVAEITGQVNRYDEESGAFAPVQVGEKISGPTLYFTGAESELIISYPAKIVARFGENTRAVVGPEEDGRYEVDLQLGTVSALLDPTRDKEKEPAFSIRGSGGVTEATGTFYAVTEYKGQTYTAVKKGEVKKKTTPPAKPDFSAYIKKAKAKADAVGQSSRAR
jgi:hypothetical protein